MCGRFALAQEHEALRVRFGFSDDPEASYQQVPRYNVAPTQMLGVVRQNGGRKLTPMRWGLIPTWAKDPKIGSSLINARSETVAEKPSFRDSFRKRRCLVPATGFFEWQKVPASTSKQPFHIHLLNESVFAFAGLWSHWADPQSKQEWLTYAILTTEANELMKPIHDRMPVILAPDNEAQWCDPSTPAEQLHELFRPFPAEQMEAYPVSTSVNSPRNDIPTCLAPKM